MLSVEKNDLTMQSKNDLYYGRLLKRQPPTQFSPELPSPRKSNETNNKGPHHSLWERNSLFYTHLFNYKLLRKWNGFVTPEFLFYL